MREINPITWFSDREIYYIPRHFVLVRILITRERKEWILENLTGRFCLVETPGLSNQNIPDFGFYPAFEDPAEAALFELVWG